MLGGRYYVPLPKMAPRQITTVHKRFESIGFKVTESNPLRASKARAWIRVDASGLCSSNEDPSNVLAPAIPDVLACEKRKVSFSVLRDSYFASEKRGNKLLLRLSPRLESQSYWNELRSTGSCALTPDERAVYSAVLASRASPAPLVTDFPVKGSKIRRMGRRQYYKSMLEPAEAVHTLRGMDSTGERNAYLPRDSILSPSPGRIPKEELASLFERLDEWCFLTAE